MAFSRNAANRIRRETLKSERNPRQDAPPPPAAPTGGENLYYMRVTSQIGVATSTTLGKGAGRVQAITYNASDVASYADSNTDTFPIYSGSTLAGTEIAVGRIVMVARMAGRFHVVTDFCTS